MARSNLHLRRRRRPRSPHRARTQQRRSTFPWRRGAEGPEPTAGAEAAPEAAAEPEGPELDKHDPKNRSHKHHGIIGVGAGVGYGLITAGDKFCGEFSTSETDPDRRKSICTAMIPAFLDFTLGFGAAERIDVVVGMRLNVMKRRYRDDKCPSGVDVCTDGKGLFINQLAMGVLPGVRIWSGKVQKIVKFGGGIDIMYMFENMRGYRNRPRLGADGDEGGMGEDMDQDAERDVGDHILGIRGGPVIQIDPHHNVGIFIYPAVQLSFRPEKAGAKEAGWFEAGFEGSLGLQARFP